jgi:ribosomal protein L7Ae-like RNA K-turn-binding protein
MSRVFVRVYDCDGTRAFAHLWVGWAASRSKNLRRGVKEVVKAIRKGETGVVLIAGDISPIDVIAHIPVLCEDSHLPYCFVPSKVR